MKKRAIIIFMLSLVLQSTLNGCGQIETSQANTNMEKVRYKEGNTMENTERNARQNRDQNSDQTELSNINKISPDTSITKMEEDLSVVRYEGDYGFGSFLEQGGASSDEEVVEYVSSRLSSNLPELLFGGNPFG